MIAKSERGRYDVVVRRDVPMHTRDGKRLLADVYLPEASSSGGSWPTLLRRTPYGKRLNDLAEDFNEAHYYASHGYLTVVQDTRGRYGSDGAWYPFAYEARDGYDAVEWAASLPESNGRVGTFGQSYGAISQYLAATQRPPHLVTAIPVSGYLMGFENYWFNRGALELSWTLSYFMNMADDVLARNGDVERQDALNAMKVDPTIRFGPLTDDALRHLPLSDWVDRFGPGAPFLTDVLHHTQDGPYWWAVDLRRQLHNIDVPMLHIGSWYDIANWDTPQYYTGLQAAALTQRSRDNQALFMGPWAHLLPYNQPTRTGTGDIDFGDEAEISMLSVQRTWFDHYVRDAAEGLPCAPVTLFALGTNRWETAESWPPPRTAPTELFLRSDPAAATSRHGRLTWDPPSDPEPPHRYVYDPQDPVPSAGGRYVGGGVADQRSRQGRPDVLAFTTANRPTDLKLTGAIELRLYAATDVTDTDFIAVLSDIYPDGFEQNLVEGIVRGRFRESFDEPTPLQPGELYEFIIPLGNLNHVLLAGHRLSLHVTSSNFPRWDRNLNTGESIVNGTTWQVAHQTVFHDPGRPSRLILPLRDPGPLTLNPTSEETP